MAISWVTSAGAKINAGYKIQLTVSEPANFSIVSGNNVTLSGNLTSICTVYCLIGLGAVVIRATAVSDGSTADYTLLAYGIDPPFVAKKLGYSSNSVGTLCKNDHGRINKFSPFKPIRSNANRPDDIYSTTGLSFYHQNGCGMDLTSAEWSGSTTLTSFLGNISSATSTWTYLPPRGSSYSEKYSLGDFRGYQTGKNKIELYNVNSGNKSILQRTTTGEIGNLTATKTNWDKFTMENNTSPIGLLTLSDVWVDTVSTNNLSNYWLTLIFYSSSADSSNYYVHSLFQLGSTLKNVNLTLEDIYKNIYQTGNDSIFYMDHSLKRYLVLTQNQISGYPAFPTSGLSLSKTSFDSTYSSTINIGRTFRMLLTGSDVPAYINNTLSLRTYMNLVVTNVDLENFNATYSIASYEAYTDTFIENLVTDVLIQLENGQSTTITIPAVQCDKYYEIIFTHDDNQIEGWLDVENDGTYESYFRAIQWQGRGRIRLDLGTAYFTGNYTDLKYTNVWHTIPFQLKIKKVTYQLFFQTPAGGVSNLIVQPLEMGELGVGSSNDVYPQVPTSKPIIAFSDYSGTEGSNRILATCTGFGLASDSWVLITGNTYYNGSYLIHRVDADHFSFGHTYYSGAGSTGTMTEETMAVLVVGDSYPAYILALGGGTPFGFYNNSDYYFRVWKDSGDHIPGNGDAFANVSGISVATPNTDNFSMLEIYNIAPDSTYIDFRCTLSIDSSVVSSNMVTATINILTA